MPESAFGPGQPTSAPAAEAPAEPSHCPTVLATVLDLHRGSILAI